MQTIRRKKQDSLQTLKPLLLEFAQLVAGEGEEQAAQELEGIARLIPGSKASEKSTCVSQICARLQEAFEGEHELNAYLFRRDDFSQWSKQEDLYLSASKIWALCQRLGRGLEKTQK
ncbi:MAG: hypothetical protein OXT67_00120 [Zetaproteobacteria bacterium]|nr:hypothetical protein [Zetaproteobacteria bacterium]